MSLFSDFQNAWSRRFPDCELPQAWEEDVRANLNRHKQRVAELREELEKECFYVEYLERLLIDAEHHRRRTLTTSDPQEDPGSWKDQSCFPGPDPETEAPTASVLLTTTTTTHSPSIKHGVASSIGLVMETRGSCSVIGATAKTTTTTNNSDSEKPMTSSPEATKVVEEPRPTTGSYLGTEIRTGGGDNKVPPLFSPGNLDKEDSSDAHEREEDDKTEKRCDSGFPPPQQDKHGFVTVIEVNGFGKPEEKERATTTILGNLVATNSTKTVVPSKDSVDEDEDGDDSSKVSSLDSPSMNTARSSDSSLSSPALKKKVPPKPPPKRPKRPLSTQNAATATVAAHEGTTGSFREARESFKERADSFKGRTEPSREVTDSFREAGPGHRGSGRIQPRDGLPGTAAGHRPCTSPTSKTADELGSGLPLRTFKPGPPKSDSFKSSCSETSTKEDGGSSGTHRHGHRSGRSGTTSEEESGQAPSSDKSLDYDDLTLKSQASVRSGHSSHSGGLSDGDPVSGYTEDGPSAEDDEEEGGGRDADQEGNEDDSPKYSDYVNIDYFLRRKAKLKHRAMSRGDSVTMDSDEDDDDDDGMGVLVQTLVRDIEKKQQLASRARDHRGNTTIAATKDREEDGGGGYNSPYVGPSKEDSVDGDSGVFATPGESPSFLCPSTPPTTPPVVAEWSLSPSGGSGRPQERDSTETITIIKCIVNSILESETIYCDCLNILLQYMKALQSTCGTSQPVISQEDLNAIFFKIPELHAIHQTFFDGIRNRLLHWDGKLTIGDHFKILASRLGIYGAYLRNYPKAIETVRKCSSENAKFDDITKAIKLKALHGQVLSLEDLLHIPVARVQKNALVLHDLLKYTPESHPDFATLQAALKITQCFLNEFNMSATESMFPSLGRTQRLLVKNSFIVELSEGHRKLRHLFLFNDVIVCAKYKKVSGREKFTYEVKWYIPLKDVVLPADGDDKDVKETSVVNVLSLKSQVTNIRDLIMQEECANKMKSKSSSRNMDKLRKKLAELQAQLMLASPNLVFRIGQKNGRKYVFFLSSKFECSQWQEAIGALQAHAPSASSLTLYELQAWITVSHKNHQTNMGSFLLRSGTEDSVLVGDLHVTVHSLQGLSKPSNMFLSLEIDSYGHFFRKATTKVAYDTLEPTWNQNFIIELEGSHMLRILCYEEVSEQENILRAKGAIELNKSWLTNYMQEKSLSLRELTIQLSLKFVQCEMSLRRTPSSKPCGVFGLKLSQVLKKEKRTIPFLIACCVREVDKRGLKELGIYRVSGSTSEMQKLKRFFETNPYEAEQLTKEIDIHAVTGILKLYLRELPEGLFTDELYPKFLEAFGKADAEEKSRSLLGLYDALPPPNKAIITYLIDHMIRIIQEEAENKMSLQNVATVFGPTLLRLSAKQDIGNTSDKLAAGTIDVMAQAGILYFYLKRQASKETGVSLPTE